MFGINALRRIVKVIICTNAVHIWAGSRGAGGGGGFGSWGEIRVAVVVENRRVLLADWWFNSDVLTS